MLTRLLDLPELTRLEAGVTLQAALPDSVSSLRRLGDWARQRVRRGGAPVHVRLEQGRQVPDDRVEALLADWPTAAADDRVEVDAALLRLLDEALRPEWAEGLRVGLATADLFAIASALGTARRRGVEGQLQVELPLGTAPALVEAVRAAGWKIWLEPTAVVDHAVHAERCRSRYYWRRLWWTGVTRARGADSSAKLGLRLILAAPIRLALYAVTRDRIYLYRSAETAGFLVERTRALRGSP